jgi:hypothetical protein
LEISLWRSVRKIIRVTRNRHRVKVEEPTITTHYYISTGKLTAKQLAMLIYMALNILRYKGVTNIGEAMYNNVLDFKRFCRNYGGVCFYC